MKIVHIIPGSGGSFYCGNCLRDSKYVQSLRNLGHDVIKLPMYLPLYADERDITDIPVFYGAVSIYLKQLYPIFRRAPRWFDRLLNSKPVLKLAAGMAGSTRAKGLEEMTVSMLLGEDGKQRDELEHMVNWLAEYEQPDVIHLSNALLLGLSHRLKERLDAKIVCSLQDEDVWVDVMTPEYQEKVWQLMHDNSAYVDAFVSVSDYFADAMLEKMKLPEQKVSTLHLGVDPDDYRPVDPDNKTRSIGFLSRMCPANGMDILVDAFILLKKDRRFDDVHLVLSGGSTGDDRKFIRQNKKKLKREGLSGSVVCCDDFDCGRMEFFDQVSVLSVPVPGGEAFGLYLLEAMASGIPVVQPQAGAFPEIISRSGGGLTFTPNNPEKLAETLAVILDDPVMLKAKSESAIKGVQEHFNIKTQAARLIDIYEGVATNSKTDTRKVDYVS